MNKVRVANNDYRFFTSNIVDGNTEQRKMVQRKLTKTLA